MMESLPPMKTVTLALSMPHDPLVRTGTISDGSCFFHAYLLSSSKSYRKYTDDEKVQKVVELRKQIADFVTPEVWFLLGDIATVDMEKELMNVLEILFIQKQCPLSCDENAAAVLRILQDVVQYPAIEKCFLPYHEDQVVKNVEHYFSDLFPGTVSDPQMSNFVRQATNFFLEMCRYCYEKSLHQFKEDMANISYFVDDRLLVAIRAFSDFDLIFIDSVERKRYQTIKTSGRKPVLIFLWLNHCHYESVGRLLSMNRIQRMFQANDELVQVLERD